MTFSLGLATFLTPKTQPNRAKTSFYKAKPCILLCFCVFLHDFRVFGAPGEPGAAPGEPRAAPGTPQGVPEALRTLLGGPNGASAGPPGVLLERSWCLLKRSRDALDGSWRLLAAPRALPGRFWRSPDALLGPFGAPGPHSRAFFFPESLFLLAFGATATKTATASWSLALEALDQGSWALALESWALARGSLALARGSWALALGS